MEDALAPLSSPVKQPRRPSCGEGLYPTPEALWTASRCKRLLRPVESRLILLRKQRKIGGLSDGTGRASGVEAQPRPNGSVRGTEGTQACMTDNSILAKRHSRRDDPDWVPSSCIRKKVKYKYSGRSNEDGKHAGVGGQAIHANDHTINGLLNKSTVATPSLFKYHKDGVEEHERCRNDSQGGSSMNNNAMLATICGLKRTRLPYLANVSGQLPTTVLHLLKKQSEPLSWALVEGVVHGFISLLKATANFLPGTRSGTRSLVSTCLRNVPTYIAEEQALQQENSEDTQVDVSSGVYADLEEYGLFQGPGWTRLSEIVRAHGVALLSDAIYEGLLNQCVARALIQICVHYSAYDEAEALVSCLVSIQLSFDRPGAVANKDIDHRAKIGLSTLERFAQQTGRRGFQYRLIESLLLTECLPMRFLATIQFTETWGHIIQSISHMDKDSTDALRLIYIAIMFACNSVLDAPENLIHGLRLSLTDGSTRHRGKTMRLRTRQSRSHAQLAKCKGEGSESETGSESQSRTALSRTVSRLLTLLSATALYRIRSDWTSTHNFGYHHLEVRAITNLAVAARSISELKPIIYVAGTQSEEMVALVLMAQNILPAIRSLPVGTSLTNRPGEIAEARLSNFVVGFPKHFIATPGILHTLAAFVSSVGSCAGRISQSGGFDYIQILSRFLTDSVNVVSMTNHMSSLERQAFAYVGSKSALIYAKESPSAAHFDFAEHMSQVARRQGLDEDSLSGPCRASSTRFRWEEGISEWVAATPATNNKKRKVSARSSSISTQSSDIEECISTTDSDSDVNGVSSSETSHDPNVLDSQPAANITAHIRMRDLAHDWKKRLHRTSRPRSRKGRTTTSYHSNGDRERRQLANSTMVSESEDELSFA